MSTWLLAFDFGWCFAAFTWVDFLLVLLCGVLRAWLLVSYVCFVLACLFVVWFSVLCLFRLMLICVVLLR